MRNFIILFSISLYSFATIYPSKLRVLRPDAKALQQDIYMILAKSDLPDVSFSLKDSTEFNKVKIKCDSDIKLEVEARVEEQMSTLYYGMQKLGFYFPHPKFQISPKREDALKQCGKTFEWKPAFKYRGFHFHTMHPNEWVHGFLLGKKRISLSSVRWLARNMQNVFEINLLRSVKSKKIFKNIKEPLALAKKLGVHSGLSASFALQQQKAYRFIRPLRLLFGFGVKKAIISGMKKIIDHNDISFLSLNAGTSEFTKTNYEKSIEWMDIAGDYAESRGVQLFMHVHVSSNQNKEPYGNFNFLPKFSNSNVGVWPHTVMFYGLYDESAPMYDNKNFKHILDFTKEQKSKRPTWYYPETSYFIALDIDVPLLLTDYLKARAIDMKNLSQVEKLEGHINFSTGHELGYWLMDWSVALHTNMDFKFDPYASLKILKEDMSAWKKIFDFQSQYIKNEQAISILTGSTLPDEVSKKHRILQRNTMFELYKNEDLLDDELKLLDKMIRDIPSISQVKNVELKTLLYLTFSRILHAKNVRKSLKFKDQKDQYLDKAKEIREKSLNIMQKYVSKFNRYPEAHIFHRHKNPTSYGWGYGAPARVLHFWKREEEMVRRELYSPLFMNIYNVWRTIF